jgi:HEPN domain-containing protein
MKPTTREWIRIAELDFRVALRVSEPPFMSEAVCYNAQQCTEKYLKAVLQEAGRPIPRIHDLGRLCRLVVDLLPEIAVLEDDLETVATFAFATRYPFSEGPFEEIGDEAKIAAATMRAVRRIVRLHLGLSDDDE